MRSSVPASVRNSFLPTLVARLTSAFSACWVLTMARTAAPTASGFFSITLSDVTNADIV